MTAHSRKQAIHRRDTTNVYSDLGYLAPESMRVKAQLVSRIGALLVARGMNEAKAATLLGIPKSKLYKVLRGQFRSFSLYKLIECLNQLGQEVHVIVRQRRDQP
jgi:predicted XRE-type DNA-binding protein